MAKNTDTAAPMAPTTPLLLVTNNTSHTITIGSVHAQTTAGSNALTLIHHKEAGMAVLAGTGQLKYINYVTATPSSIAVNWWSVNSTDPLVASGTYTASATQSTFGNPYWAGLYITASNSSGQMNQSAATPGYRNSVGDTSLGAFNSSISFTNGGGTCTATWSYNAVFNEYHVDIN